MKDPYAVLGLDKSASPEQLKAKYQELHDIYGEQRFKSGEEGNEGARKLQELEEAWAIIGANIERDSKSAAFGGDYSQIDDLIRQGKYNEAQDILDSIQDRKGEWHYMQAIVFYKREWLSEAKSQLEMALREEPNNAKYRSSLDKLNLAMGAPQPSPFQNQSNGNYNNGNYNQQPYIDQNGQYPQQQPADMANCLSSCCCAYCLTDLLCNAMRCC
ncbi:MAG: hypothetical protein J1G01_05645 [Clostridiales bacterium]|nr:hypothetical protein [Clostridiales bacterium]